MKPWPSTLGGRIALALAFAVVAVGCLDLALRRFDRGPAPTRRAGGSGQLGIDESAFEPLPLSLGFRLQPTPGTIVLARRFASLPPDVAPVVEILGDGQLVLRRPRPLATGPEQRPRLSRDGHGAAVILPVADLAAMSPTARGSLVGLLQQWVLDRPVPLSRIQVADFDVPPAVLQRLLAWVP